MAISPQAIHLKDHTFSPLDILKHLKPTTAGASFLQKYLPTSLKSRIDALSTILQKHRLPIALGTSVATLASFCFYRIYLAGDIGNTPIADLMQRAAATTNPFALATNGAFNSTLLSGVSFVPEIKREGMAFRIPSQNMTDISERTIPGFNSTRDDAFKVANHAHESSSEQSDLMLVAQPSKTISSSSERGIGLPLGALGTVLSAIWYLRRLREEGRTMESPSNAIGNGVKQTSHIAAAIKQQLEAGKKQKVENEALQAEMEKASRTIAELTGAREALQAANEKASGTIEELTDACEALKTQLQQSSLFMTPRKRVAASPLRTPMSAKTPGVRYRLDDALPDLLQKLGLSIEAKPECYATVKDWLLITLIERQVADTKKINKLNIENQKLMIEIAGKSVENLIENRLDDNESFSEDFEECLFISSEDPIRTLNIAGILDMLELQHTKRPSCYANDQDWVISLLLGQQSELRSEVVVLEKKVKFLEWVKALQKTLDDKRELIQALEQAKCKAYEERGKAKEETRQLTKNVKQLQEELLRALEPPRVQSPNTSLNVSLDDSGILNTSLDASGYGEEMVHQIAEISERLKKLTSQPLDDPLPPAEIEETQTLTPATKPALTPEKEKLTPKATEQAPAESARKNQGHPSHVLLEVDDAYLKAHLSHRDPRLSHLSPTLNDSWDSDSSFESPTVTSSEELT